MINKSYLIGKDQIKTALGRDEIVILKDFFIVEFYDKLKLEIKNTKMNFERKPLSFSYCNGKYTLPKEVVDFFEKLIGDKIKKTEAYNFKWKDYTLLNDAIKQNSGFEVVIDLTDNWNPGAGGQICYGGKSAVIPVQGNSITIVKGDVLRYVKYVNHLAKDKERVLIICS